MESQSWNLAKSLEEENKETVVINNHQAKRFCKKKTGHILPNVHNEYPQQSYFTMGTSLSILPRNQKKRMGKEREGRGERIH